VEAFEPEHAAEPVALREPARIVHQRGDSETAAAVGGEVDAAAGVAEAEPAEAVVDERVHVAQSEVDGEPLARLHGRAERH
jgi:hypothetical protein